MANYLKPRRGKKSTAISQLSSSTPLQRGEVFFEVPDAGVGTGAGKIKMGDGVHGYDDLPYFMDIPVVKTATLAAGATTVTFTSIPTSGNYLFSLYTDKAGLNYTAVDDTTSGQLTYTFEAQSSAVSVYLEIKGVS